MVGASSVSKPRCWHRTFGDWGFGRRRPLPPPPSTHALCDVATDVATSPTPPPRARAQIQRAVGGQREQHPLDIRREPSGPEHPASAPSTPRRPTARRAGAHRAGGPCSRTIHAGASTPARGTCLVAEPATRSRGGAPDAPSPKQELTAVGLDSVRHRRGHGFGLQAAAGIDLPSRMGSLGPRGDRNTRPFGGTFQVI
jgi:hypothetical protein